MKVYLDVDALHKLGAFNALNEVLTVLGVSSAEVWVPGTAKYKLRLKTDAEAVKRHGADTAARLRDFIGLVHEISEGPTEDEKRQLEQIQGLDAGELLLIAMAARSDDSLIVTGDKNAMRALASQQRCAQFATRLAGRVICLEQLLVALLDLHGFPWLHGRVSASPATDRGVASIVAPGIGASEANARAGFTSFINHLRGQTGPLLKLGMG